MTDANLILERNRRKNGFGKFHSPGDGTSAATKADAQRLLAQIPADTRNLTARLCGDPLPGRRAIDPKFQQGTKQ